MRSKVLVSLALVCVFIIGSFNFSYPIDDQDDSEESEEVGIKVRQVEERVEEQNPGPQEQEKTEFEIDYDIVDEYISSNSHLEDQLNNDLGTNLPDGAVEEKKDLSHAPADDNSGSSGEDAELPFELSEPRERGALLTVDTMIVLQYPEEINWGDNLTVTGYVVEMGQNPDPQNISFMPVPFAQVWVFFPYLDQMEEKLEVETSQSGKFEAKFSGYAAQMPAGFSKIYANFSGHWYDENANQGLWPYVHTDTGGPQVRRASNTQELVKVIHSTTIDNLEISPSTIVVGNSISVSGVLRDNESQGLGINNALIELYLDGKVFPDSSGSKIYTVSGVFDYTGLEIPDTKSTWGRPGEHVISVYFKRSKQEGVNTNYTDASASKSFGVKRTVTIVFQDRLAEGEQVYRGKPANVSGQILDNVGDPMKKYVSGEEFIYEVDITWGGKSIGSTEVESSGNFYFQYNIPKQENLGIVTITVTFTPPTGAYYTSDSTSAKWMIMATPSIDMNMERFGRRNRDFIIKGQLVDDLGDGLPNRAVFIRWGDSQSTFNLTTDDDGHFEKEYHIPASQKLGPVFVAVNFEGEKNLYDPCSTPPPPAEDGIVYLVSGTWITVNVNENVKNIKGETITIQGRLWDDLNHSIPYKKVRFKWYEDDKDKDGVLVGYYETDANGVFAIPYKIEATQPVGNAYAEISFNGSNEFTEGESYLGAKASHVSLAHNTNLFSANEISNLGKGRGNYTIYAKTVLDIQSAPRAVRNESIDISVGLYEYINGQKRGGVYNKRIMLKIGSQSFNPKKTDASGKARFSITLPPLMEKGKVNVVASYNTSADSFYLSSTNQTQISITVKTKFVVEEAPARIFEGDKPRWKIRLVEADAPTQQGVPDASVDFIISIVEWNSYKPLNLSTNDYGTIDHSEPFDVVSSPGTLEITLKYNGSVNEFYEGCNVTLSPVHIEPPSADIDGEENMLPLYIGLAIAAAVIVVILFFVASYVKKKKKYSDVKKIITRARDHLIVGDAYRETIFWAYQRLVLHLRRYGYLRRKSETFREFEKAIRSALPVDQEAMNEFLTLLEEARYSNHPFGPEHRTTAVDTLKRIEGSLDQIMVSEEAALQAIERVEGEAAEDEVEIVLASEAERRGLLDEGAKGAPAGAMPAKEGEKGVPPGEQKGLPPQKGGKGPGGKGKTPPKGPPKGGKGPGGKGKAPSKGPPKGGKGPGGKGKAPPKGGKKK